MKVAITGHRPEDLPNIGWVEEALADVFRKLNPELVIQGMAAGVDLLSAEVASRLGFPVLCARPWAGHTPRATDRDLYRKVLNEATEVVDVNPNTDYQGPWMYHNRNEYMVDHADILVAVWSGKTFGGTAACVKYAKRKQKPIVQINPITQTVTYPEPVEPSPSTDVLF